MSSWKATPSTAHTVAPDTPISECVRIMRDRGFGSILVTDRNGSMLGIFTERDLLKWIDEIQHGGHWNKAISTLMSKPVFTLSIDELDIAAETMIEKNIRHLPITYEDPMYGKVLAGVISMRDLLKEVVIKKKISKSIKKQLRAGMISSNEAIRQLIRKICSQQGSISVETFQADAEKLVEQIQDLDYIFFDLDGVDKKIWVPVLKELNAMPDHPRILLFYDFTKHEESELELFAKLSLSQQFSAYMKPLNIFTILSRLT